MLILSERYVVGYIGAKVTTETLTSLRLLIFSEKSPRSCVVEVHLVALFLCTTRFNTIHVHGNKRQWHLQERTHQI
jgi:hypothetical protein